MVIFYSYWLGFGMCCFICPYLSLSLLCVSITLLVLVLVEEWHVVHMFQNLHFYKKIHVLL